MKRRIAILALGITALLAVPGVANAAPDGATTYKSSATAPGICFNLKDLKVGFCLPALF